MQQELVAYEDGLAYNVSDQEITHERVVAYESFGRKVGIIMLIVTSVVLVLLTCGIAYHRRVSRMYNSMNH